VDETKELTDMVLLFHASETETVLDTPFRFSISTRRLVEVMFSAQASLLPFVLPLLERLQAMNNNDALDEACLLTERRDHGQRSKLTVISVKRMERICLVHPLHLLPCITSCVPTSHCVPACVRVSCVRAC
jgi:hypothetical protein